MKVYVAGATGRVASELILDLAEAGHTVIAGARRPENVTAVTDKRSRGRAGSVKLDLHASAPEIADTLGHAEAVYFVAGSRGKDLLQTDAFGAVKLMRAAQGKGIKRFVMLSSLYSLEPEKWNSEQMKPLANYNTAKFFADNYLISSTSLDYTILQASSLTEEPGTGKISTGAKAGMTNPIADVATTLSALLNHPNTVGKVIRMGSGDTPIDEALEKI